MGAAPRLEIPDRAGGHDAVINSGRHRHRAAQIAHLHWSVGVGSGHITQLAMPIVAASMGRSRVRLRSSNMAAFSSPPVSRHIASSPPEAYRGKTLGTSAAEHEQPS